MSIIDQARVFVRVVRLSFQQQLTYRMAVLAGLATNFFFALLRTAVIIALYANQGEVVNGLSLQGAITYVAVSQGLIAFLHVFGWFDIMTTVYSGAIGSDLLKPVRFFSLWMARELGRSLVNLVGRGVVLIALFSLVYSILIPDRAGQWLALGLALLLGWLVSFSWRFLVNLAAFWSPDARGFGRVAFTLSQLLSGFMMPLRLYPDWFVKLCKLTPFPALFNTTLEVYLDLLQGPELWFALVNQLFWFLALTAIAHLVLSFGIRRLVVQGG